ncbi:MAG: ankyrin repeat domain-containing protein [Candidatus Amoebophilus sp.]
MQFSKRKNYLVIVLAICCLQVLVSCGCGNNPTSPVTKKNHITKKVKHIPPVHLLLRSNKQILKNTDKSFKLSLENTSETIANLSNGILRITLQEEGDSGSTLRYATNTNIYEHQEAVERPLSYFTQQVTLKKGDAPLVIPFELHTLPTVTSVKITVKLEYKGKKDIVSPLTIVWNGMPPITEDMIQIVVHNGYKLLADILTKLQKGEEIGINNVTAVYPKEAALHQAVKLGDEYIVELLLEKGANINIQNIEGETVLHLATNSNNTELVKKLIDKGVKLEVQNKRGYTPLHLAAEQGYIDVTKELIPHLNSEQLNLSNKEGQTPLHLAASWGHSKFVSLLIPYLDICKLNQKDLQCNSALYKASQYGHIETVKKLLDAGAKIDEVNCLGFTPLHISIIEGTSAVALELINRLSTEQLNQPDINEYTPLYLAILHSHTEIAEELIKKLEPAQLNKQNDQENTPLHKAVEKSNIKIAKQLIAKGADITIKNKKGQSPMDLAKSDEMREVFQFM